MRLVEFSWLITEVVARKKVHSISMMMFVMFVS